MSKTPFFYIIVPTYNRKNIISESLDSVLNQDYSHYKIIVIDDGSSDGTENFLEQKYGFEGKINYFYKDNGGVGSARNLGIKKVLLQNSIDDSYIIFLDSDDRLYNSKSLGDIASTIREDISCYGFSVIDEKGVSKSSIKSPESFIITDALETVSYIRGEFLYCFDLDIFIENHFIFDEDINGGESIFWNKINTLYPFLYSKAVMREYFLSDVSICRGKITSETLKNMNRVNEKIVSELGSLYAIGNKKKLGILYINLARGYTLLNEYKKGFDYFLKSLKYSFDIKRIGLYFISWFDRKYVINNFLIRFLK